MRHRGFIAARRKGMADMVGGAAREECPYVAPAFANYWRIGWDAAAQDREQAVLTLSFRPIYPPQYKKRQSRG